MVVKGPAGEVVGHYTEVKEQPLSSSLGEKAYIRWLITSSLGAPNYAMRLFRLEPEGKIYSHSHPWEHEIYILKGKLKIRVNGTWYTVKEGDFVYIPPNAEHEYTNLSGGESLFICVIPNKK